MHPSGGWSAKRRNLMGDLLIGWIRRSRKALVGQGVLWPLTAADHRRADGDVAEKADEPTEALPLRCRGAVVVLSRRSLASNRLKTDLLCIRRDDMHPTALGCDCSRDHGPRILVNPRERSPTERTDSRA